MMNIFLNVLRAAGIESEKITNVTIEGRDPVLPSPFLICEAGAAALAAVGYLAAELWFLKTKRQQQVSIDVANAALVQCSHQYSRVLDGENKELWSPFSGFYQTKDNRWIQFHCNFPHHQQGVIDLLGCEEN